MSIGVYRVCVSSLRFLAGLVAIIDVGDCWL